MGRGTGTPPPTPPGTLMAPGAVPQVILAEVSPRGFLRSLGDAEELGAAGEGAPLYAFQPPPARHAGTAPPHPDWLVPGHLHSPDWLGEWVGWELCLGRRELPWDWWEVVVPLAVIGGWEVCCDWWECIVLSAMIGQGQLVSTGIGGRWSLLGWVGD